MSLSSLFESDFDFDESVRVDREASGENQEEKQKLLQTYYVTESTEEYLQDLFARILGEAEDDREGYNHWLYGYYGSGKSHLLAVTGLLLDSAWVRLMGQDVVWSDLAGDEDDLSDLRELWERCLDEYEVWPLFVNLLKEQGNRQRGFGTVILRHLHQNRGLSPQLKVAFFEKWYLQNHSSQELQENARQVLQEVAPNLNGDSLWERVQKYPVLAEGTLPILFEEETDSQDGYNDVVDRDLKPEVVARQLEEQRKEVGQDDSRSTKMLLLLDEVTLFIGTRYGLLTELNALAEAIDEVGDGELLTVGTAQEDPSRVQTEYSAREVDFSILDDRFPHKYSLPSSHVGEIVRNRLLRKSEEGEEVFKNALSDAKRSLGDSFVFSDVQQNTDPPLNEIDEAATAYLPLLPYQPPLFLEILSHLRTEEADRAKSIFSGTARAILAIVNGLLKQWGADPGGPLDGKEGNPERLISLVDFFEVIRPELKDIIPQEIDTIEDVEEKVDDGDLQPIDADVCKVVLLLQRVPDMVPLDDLSNIAVGVMDDLDGDGVLTQASTVKESLGRLEKFIRVDQEYRSYRRFTTQEERSILDTAEQKERQFGDKDVVEELTKPVLGFEDRPQTTLWKEILRHLEMPSQVPYEEEGDTYPVHYIFDIDGDEFQSSYGGEEALQVRIHVDRLVAEEARPDNEHTEAFLWRLDADGGEALYRRLKKWAALSAACRDQTTIPPTIERELRSKSEDLPERIATRIQNGDLKVRANRPATVSQGVRQYVQEAYSSAYHPEMLRIDERRLQQLNGIRQSINLPDWAKKINVSCDSQSSITRDIVSTVRQVVGQHLRDVKTVSVTGALDKLREEEENYEGVEHALVAHLWGLCRRGDFQAITEDGDPLRADVLLDANRWHEIQLRDGQSGDLRSHLEKIPDVDGRDTLDQAIVKARAFIDEQRQRLDTLRQEIQAARETASTGPVDRILGSLEAWLDESHEEVSRWLKTTRSPRPNWASVVNGILGKQDAIQTARNQWDRREAYILQLDALLLLSNHHAEILTEDLRELFDDLEGGARMAADARWWTEDGWSDFVDRLGAYNQTVQKVDAWWQEVRTENSREELWEETEDHSWLGDNVSTTSVGRSFKQRLLRPLLDFRQSMDRAQRILKPLTEDAHGLDPSKLQWTLGRLQDERELSIPSKEEVEDGLLKLRIVDQITDGAAPDEFEGIGCWPDDSAELKDALYELVQEKADLTFEDTEHGITLSA